LGGGLDETQWQTYLETRQAVERDNPGLDFRLADFFAAWTAQHGKPDAGVLRLETLRESLRAAWARENGVAGLQTCFSGIHTGGIEA
jgi:hypothetical protein